MLRIFAGDSFFRHVVSCPAHHRRRLTIAISAACLSLTATLGHAGVSLRAGAMSHNGSSSAAATSQTATAATDNTSQTVTTSAGAAQAQASLAKSVQALQALQAAQISARAAASASTLGLAPGLAAPTDGLGGGAGLTGGLVPTFQAGETLTATSTPSVQIVKLGAAGNNTLNLTGGGTVVVPEGTSGSDSVTVTGSGSVTSSGGNVTTNAGTLTTSSGATLSSLQGGSISLKGGSATLAVVTTTNLTSSLSGTITVANGGGQFALAAGVATTIPAGSTISFTGTGAGTVTIASSTASTSPSTVTLTGAGTLTLANAPATGSGGTITTNTGVASFSSGATTTLPAGSKINLTGAGSLSFAGATNDTLSVLLNTGQNGTANGTSNFTTTGSVLSTTSFNVPSTWTLGAGGALSQSFDSATNHITDTVTQEQQQALLYWSSFNIGKNTTLSFDQSAGGANVGQWVAINQITDPSLAPSQILGSIKAPGQVYVVNQNGIIFGGSSQINAHALVASSLPINTNLVQQGLLAGAVTDYQYLFSQLTIPALTGLSSATSAYTPPAAPAGGDGNVVVDAGAELESPTNAENVGGRIALVGPVVENNGEIDVPDGQAILAAGLQVGFNAHSENDPSLRGLDTFVGKVTDPTYDGGTTTDAAGNALGTAINNGDIEAPRADVTITGAAVRQNGVINSSTSVTLNGRVDLLADYDSTVINFNGALSIYPTQSGSVEFGANSLTQILPEMSSSATVVGTSLALPSVVNVQGNVIYFGQNAELLAPGAAINSSDPAVDLIGSDLSAGVTLSAGNWLQNGFSYNFVDTSGQVYFDTDSLIDVSGSSVSASVAEDVVPVQLRGPQLADSPVQQNGALRGDTVYVDIRDYGVYDGSAWIGTPLADASGYAGLIARDVGELTVNGGSVAINAGTSVVMQPGATINVSGGAINYQGASVPTTEVVAAGGQILNISEATPNLVYSGLDEGYSSSSAKWGVTQKFLNSLITGTQYDPGYLQGGNAGSISITSPTMALAGQFVGLSTAGANQKSLPAQIESTFSGATFPGINFESILLPIFSMPTAGSLALSFTDSDSSGASIVPPTISPNVTFATSAQISQNPLPTVGAFNLSDPSAVALPAQLQTQVMLSQDLVNQNGFGNLTVDTSASGDILLPEGVNLNAAPGSVINLRGANVEIASTIMDPGGTLSAVAYDTSPYSASLSSVADSTRGTMTLDASAMLNFSGLVVDELKGSSVDESTATSGGAITLEGYNVSLASGSVINVSGGAVLNAANSVSYGHGGSISIVSGADPGVYTGVDSIIGGSLEMGESYYSGQSLFGYSGTTGGALSIQAPYIQVGGTAGGSTIGLSSQFFNQGGFSSFSLTGLGSESAQGSPGSAEYVPPLLLTGDTTISPLVQTWQASVTNGQLALTLLTAQQEAQLPASELGPINLSFSSRTLTAGGSTLLQGAVEIDPGASIILSPNASSSVTISGADISFGGQIVAPGGKIQFSGSSGSSQPTVVLNSGSLLSTAGQTVLSPNIEGDRTGTVLNGGTIGISGSLVAETGATLDVSGWRDELDVSSSSLGNTAKTLSFLAEVPTVEDSNAGSIVLSGGLILWSDATLLGFGGGATSANTAAGLTSGNSKAQGGTISVSAQTISNASPVAVSLTVSQTDGALPQLGNPVLGSGLTDSLGNSITSGGFITADRLSSGGFASITLSGVVSFVGNVNLTASQSLNVASGGFIYGDDSGNITLTAPYVSVGTPFSTPEEVAEDDQNNYIFTFGSDGFYSQPLAGTGVLSIDASTLADVGSLELLGISTLNFNGAVGASGFNANENAGDVRGDGVLDIAGLVNLNAREVYPPTETSFTIAAYDANGNPGTVNLYQPADNTVPSVPLSAGGILNIYASIINQDGVLRAPIGTINLGWSGSGTAPVNLVTNTAIGPTQELTLSAGSLTSVSANGAVIPYGSINSAGDWVDPAGNDITVAGSTSLPSKIINFSAESISTDSGATIDISGGGDLYANLFVSGLKGTNNFLAETTDFAVIPGYSEDYSYAPFDAVSGYSATSYSNLQVGDQIDLAGSNALAAGSYTLLPAGYALIPGGFLVTPVSGTPGAAVTLTDKSFDVAGSRFSGLSGAGEQVLSGVFNIASQSVVDTRGEYDASLADKYFPLSAPANNVAVPRLPEDAGQVVFLATQDLSLPDDSTTLLSTPADNGLGSEVDIASPTAITIYNSAAPTTASAQGLNLSTDALDAFGADSLLIGGYRQTEANGTDVNVLSNSVTVNNTGADLSGPDIILVSSGALTVQNGSEISAGNIAAPTSAPVAPNLLLSGNGALVRVSADSSALVTRTNTDPATSANVDLVIGNASILGATIGSSTTASAGVVVLDSTNQASLASSVDLSANRLDLDSGMISVVLSNLASPLASPIPGLVLSSEALATLQESVQSLSLLSYSSFDIWGSGDIGAAASGGNFPVQSLTLSTPEIRGFDNGGGVVSINAQNVTLGGVVDGTAIGPVAGLNGQLVINAQLINLNSSNVQIDQFSQTSFNATQAVFLGNGAGGLAVAGALSISTPLITAEPVVALTPEQEQKGAVPPSATVQTITAGGALILSDPAGSTTGVVEGLDASLTLEGATVTDRTSISLPSGALTLHATQGDVTVDSGGSLSTAGSAIPIHDVTEYTNGGAVTLTSDTGNVTLAPGSTINVAAQSGGGSGGSLTVNAVGGVFGFTGSNLSAAGGTSGLAGSFYLDAGSLANFDAAESYLVAGGATQIQAVRVRNGDVAVDGTVTSWNFNLETDGGSIVVNGEINASGATGGTINLQAAQSVTLANGSLLTVEGKNDNDAGQGGAVTLSAGADVQGTASTTGYVNILSGSTINLTVDAAAGQGDASGILHIRAPQFFDGSGLQVAPIQGTITGASSVEIEGYKIYDAPGGSIDAVEGNVFNDAQTFANNSTSILTTLLGAAPTAPQVALYSVMPGAEVINPNADTAANPTQGDLTLANTWDLSTYRFGPQNVPGFLTLRAGGNIVFDYGASLTDGFTGDPVYGYALSTLNAGTSWSYQITSGADFSSAGPGQVLPESQLLMFDSNINPILNAQGAPEYYGSVLLGLGAPSVSQQIGSTPGLYYQSIRTGTGNITVNAGGDVQFLDNIATVYTAGTPVADPTLGGTFQVPVLAQVNSTLGVAEPPSQVQYSDDGGNVVITAQNDIAHYTSAGGYDSSAELPTSWLFRQGAVNAQGVFATGPATGRGKSGLVQSTSWWVNFDNFYEDVGALGGGNVTMSAGNDIINVDASIPTNARMPGVNAQGQAIAPNASSLVELGGGDLSLTAGHNILGGVYYVERGQGTLAAGNQILTDAARAAVPVGIVGNTDAQTYLPISLFLGGADGADGSAHFTVTAGGDLLLGPVANPFLLPQNINNTYDDKSYFSTYSPTDSVSATSLTGNVTVQDSSDTSEGSLLSWYNKVLLSSPAGQAGTLADYETWLGLVENAGGLEDFSYLTSLMAPILDVASYSGDIDIRGNLTLTPSQGGTLNLLADGSINGFQPNGTEAVSTGAQDTVWGSTTINISDFNPLALPSYFNPAAPTSNTALVSAGATASALNPILQYFSDVTGATSGLSLQTEETIHDPSLLHAGDTTGPVRLYAELGDISGLELYSPKVTDVIAGEDITDVAFYIQNLSAGDVSVIQAGRNILAYDAVSELRSDGQQPGNLLEGESATSPLGTGFGAPEAGDLQIAGPGTLEVLAGENLNLGIGPSTSNGIGAGLVSIGNTVNPALPFAGADIIAASGLGSSDGLNSLNYTNASGTGFIDEFLNPNLSTTEPDIYLPDLADILGLPSSTSSQDVWSAFNELSTAQQNADALQIFYLVLRDAGRDHNNPASSNYGEYTEGNAAVAALFQNANGAGSISLTSREIKTTNGGDISLLARGGSVNVGLNNSGAQAVDQGILTVSGGNINIYADGDVNVGTSRIFTLHGGNEIIWSTNGNIDAGAASKTVQSAPPTRVLVYPTSGDVETDLAGLATGGGIGVLETVAGASPGDVDLIAPKGVVDAGDAGIRASGNLNIAAVQVLNASNISVGGKSTGVPSGPSVNVGALAAASSAAGSSEAAASNGNPNNQQNAANNGAQDLPSIITVEVLGFGGDDGD